MGQMTLEEIEMTTMSVAPEAEDDDMTEYAGGVRFHEPR